MAVPGGHLPTVISPEMYQFKTQCPNPLPGTRKDAAAFLFERKKVTTWGRSRTSDLGSTKPSAQPLSQPDVVTPRARSGHDRSRGHSGRSCEHHLRKARCRARADPKGLKTMLLRNLLKSASKLAESNPLSRFPSEAPIFPGRGSQNRKISGKQGVLDFEPKKWSEVKKSSTWGDGENSGEHFIC